MKQNLLKRLVMKVHDVGSWHQPRLIWWFLKLEGKKEREKPKYNMKRVFILFTFSDTDTSILATRVYLLSDPFSFGIPGNQ